MGLRDVGCARSKTEMDPPDGETGLRDSSWERSRTEMGAPDWSSLRARWGGLGGRIGSRANLIKGLEGPTWV